MKNLNYLVIIDSDDVKNILSIERIMNVILINHLKTVQLFYDQEDSVKGIKDIKATKLLNICCSNYRQIFFFLTSIKFNTTDDKYFYIKHKKDSTIISYGTIETSTQFQKTLNDLNNSVFGKE